MAQLRRPPAVMAGIGAVLRAVWRDPVLRAVLMIVTMINFLLAGPLSVGLPALAHARFVEGAAALGSMFAAFGGGMLLGTLGGGALMEPRGRGWLLFGIIGVIGAGLALLGMVGSAALAAVVLAIMGVANGFGYVLMLTWLHKRTEATMLGRVMSLVLFAGWVLAPPSQLVAGVVVDLNVSLLFVIAGILLVLTALIAALSPVVRILD
jgi:MFS family permease